MGIAEIEKIETKFYQEKDLGTINPSFFKNLSGTHSYSFDNGLLAFDYVYPQKKNY